MDTREATKKEQKAKEINAALANSNMAYAAKAVILGDGRLEYQLAYGGHRDGWYKATFRDMLFLMNQEDMAQMAAKYGRRNEAARL